MKVKMSRTGDRITKCVVTLEIEMPDGVVDYLKERKADRKLRGTNLIYRIQCDEESNLTVLCGSGMLNQGDFTKKKLYKRVANLLKRVRDDHLNPHEIAMWLVARSLVKHEATRRSILSSTSEAEHVKKTLNRLMKRVDETQMLIDAMVLRLNVELGRLTEKTE